MIGLHDSMRQAGTESQWNGIAALSHYFDVLSQNGVRQLT